MHVKLVVSAFIHDVIYGWEMERYNGTTTYENNISGPRRQGPNRDENKIIKITPSPSYDLLCVHRLFVFDLLHR